MYVHFFKIVSVCFTQRKERQNQRDPNCAQSLLAQLTQDRVNFHRQPPRRFHRSMVSVVAVSAWWCQFQCPRDLPTRIPRIALPEEKTWSLKSQKKTARLAAFGGWIENLWKCITLMELAKSIGVSSWSIPGHGSWALHGPWHGGLKNWYPQ